MHLPRFRFLGERVISGSFLQNQFTTMSNENVVSIQIPEEERKMIEQKVQEIKAALKPYLIALKPVERQTLPKMSDKTIPFVEKVMEYAKMHPEFTPPYLQTEEMEIDFQAMNDLRQLYREVAQLYKNLDDTIMLSGSEAYAAALVYYNSVRQASKMNVPNAKSIFEDLSQRFQKK